jgi:hypothetical protein
MTPFPIEGGSSPVVRSDEACVRWHAVNNNDSYRIEGCGDPTGSGAQLRIESTKQTPTDFGGAMMRLPAESVRGRKAVLTALLDATGEEIDVALWMRADGVEEERLAFTSSARFPVVGGEPAARRLVVLQVPEATEWLVCGLIVHGLGIAVANDLRLDIREPDPAVSGAEVLEVLGDVKALVREHALNAERIDWTALSGLEQTQETIDAVQGAIRELLTRLGDNHSAFLTADEVWQLDAMGCVSGPMKLELLDGSTGYIRVPGFAGIDEVAARAFSERLTDAIAKLADAAESGWIIDLRQNRGGNMWPMLSGLKAFLGDEIPGSFRDRNGAIEPWKVEGTVPSGELEHSKVAILLGERTSSAAEAIAVAFHGRPRTKSFGVQTAGRATGNRLFRLRDGSRLALTTSVMLDRNGLELGRSITPDVHCESGQEIEQALAWLKEGT